MNFADWYTDLMDVWRVQTVMDGSLTRHERVQVYAGIPCRVYQSDNRAVNMTQTASDVHQEDRLACGLDADVQAGDELIITRGARLGHKTHVVRAFAVRPQPVLRAVRGRHSRAGASGNPAQAAGACERGRKR